MITIKWILILTIANAGTNYEGNSIHSIPEYGSKIACEEAGELWKNSLHPDDKRRATAVCTRNSLGNK